ncbi:hypothetical protein tinsulaeT_10670 [Thalassotalea insulae]|uniref:Uncharacterized protein n=1 Tax=Thalassotalea insulae TaxID=2056778 RepID=A0ABQ6GP65_9GAMM|nr:hypothetical protein [Thalassotalea insulae]GLX77727.1 hypothetical protein tinsulaeT_10670 [Thalassotalea insulae]
MNVNSKSAENADSTSDNVKINKDGIVSLNLKSKSVQSKLIEQIKKLKLYENELKVAK